MSQQPSHVSRANRPATDADGVNQAMSVLSYLFGGILVYGGLGWAGAHYLHAGPLLPIGIVFGVGLGVYLIVRHYGSPGEQATSDWIEERKVNQAEWTWLAGRPAELCQHPAPDRPAGADCGVSARAGAVGAVRDRRRPGAEAPLH